MKTEINQAKRLLASHKKYLEAQIIDMESALKRVQNYESEGETEAAAQLLSAEMSSVLRIDNRPSVSFLNGKTALEIAINKHCDK